MNISRNIDMNEMNPAYIGGWDMPNWEFSYNTEVLNKNWEFACGYRLSIAFWGPAGEIMVERMGGDPRNAYVYYRHKAAMRN